MGLELMMIRFYDREALRNDFHAAKPFPHIVIDEFLEPDASERMAASYPSFEAALRHGRSFDAVNEARKVQITDARRFPEPVAELSQRLLSREFLEDLEQITGIPQLLADSEYAGGGMHLTGPGGRLDVHVDFNFMEERNWHRRLNLLLYLNPDWDPAWGGALELWDARVERCQVVVQPKLNRAVIFETSAISYHGVQPLRCPPSRQRLSFAVYYYTREAPADWDGSKHSTIVRSRPREKFRGHVLMPLERAKRRALPWLKRNVKRAIGRR